MWPTATSIGAEAANQLPLRAAGAMVAVGRGGGVAVAAPGWLGPVGLCAGSGVAATGNSVAVSDGLTGVAELVDDGIKGVAEIVGGSTVGSAIPVMITSRVGVELGGSIGVAVWVGRVSVGVAVDNSDPPLRPPNMLWRMDSKPPPPLGTLSVDASSLLVPLIELMETVTWHELPTEPVLTVTFSKAAADPARSPVKIGLAVLNVQPPLTEAVTTVP